MPRKPLSERRWPTAALAAALSLPALGQAQSERERPRSGRDSATPAAQANASKSAAARRTAKADADRVWLQFMNADIRSVALSLSVLTGRPLQLDPRVGGNLTVQSVQPVTPGQAWTLFVQALAERELRVTLTQGVHLIAPAPAIARPLEAASAGPAAQGSSRQPPSGAVAAVAPAASRPASAAGQALFEPPPAPRGHQSATGAAYAAPAEPVGLQPASLQPASLQPASLPAGAAAPVMVQAMAAATPAVVQTVAPAAPAMAATVATAAAHRLPPPPLHTPVLQAAAFQSSAPGAAVARSSLPAAPGPQASAAASRPASAAANPVAAAPAPDASSGGGPRASEPTLRLSTAPMAPNAPAASSPAALPAAEIAVEWARSPRPTLPEPSLPTPPLRPSAQEPVAVWSLLSQDKTLYHTLSRWAQKANWQLLWEADRDFPIQVQMSIEGSFSAAIELVMNSLAASDYPLQAVMNNNTRVISIVRHQDPQVR